MTTQSTSAESVAPVKTEPTLLDKAFEHHKAHNASRGTEHVICPKCSVRYSLMAKNNRPTLHLIVNGRFINPSITALDDPRLKTPVDGKKKK